VIRSAAALRIVTEALQPDAGGPAAAERRRALTDWSGPIAIANQHLLAPTLYRALRAADALADLPPEVGSHLADLAELDSARSTAFRRQAAELIRALNDAGIEPMLLSGGISLFTEVYAAGAPTLDDVAVLVPHAAAGRAREALVQIGYSVARRYPMGYHAYADLVRPHDPGAVALHVELLDAKYVLPAREVWQRARAIRHGGIEFFVPTPDDCVLHALLHAQIHYLGNYYRGALELRQLHEFATLTRHFGSVLDWAFIVRRMSRHRLDTPLESYLLAAERLLALRWPLSIPPSLRAELHYRRCIAQLRFPALAATVTPWANIRSGFAAHRMDALYHGSGPLRLTRHAVQFARKKTIAGVVDRLFRVR
jgi:hypothetical protein